MLESWWLQPDGDDDWEPFQRFFAKCATCQMPYILGRDADDIEPDNPLEQIFPETDRSLPHHVPKSVRESYDEAVKCRRVHSYTAATIMARRGC